MSWIHFWVVLIGYKLKVYLERRGQAHTFVKRSPGVANPFLKRIGYLLLGLLPLRTIGDLDHEIYRP